MILTARGGDARHDAPAPRAPQRARVLAAVAVLVVVYVAIALLGDARAASGSDAGGKLATVKVMVEDRLGRPDVGYWAARWDPGGEFHPLIYTTERDGRWVQVTSLPLVYLGIPLWRLAGANGLLLLPIAGSVLAAVGARRIARELGAPHGWTAFWLVGLASPVLFYATDFWEHSIAVGLAVLGVSFVLGRRTVPDMAVAGLLLGIAAVFRTEVAIYAVVLGVVLLAARQERLTLVRRPVVIAVALVAFAAPLAANVAVERAVLGASVRTSRATSNAGAAGDELGSRGRDALVTSLALFPEDSGASFAFGAAVVGAVAMLGWSIRRRRSTDGRTRAAAAVAGAAYLVRIVDGVGFVPGMLTASPAAAAGIGAARGRARLIAVTALASLPLVWAFEWRGQLVPQWGGRYTLLTGVLLAIVAAVEIERAGRRTPAAAVVIVLAVAVTVFGAAWHVQRTNGVAASARRVLDVPHDDVVVSGIVHLAREYGAYYGERRWLSSLGGGSLRRAVGVAGDAGAPAIDVVQVDVPAAVTSFDGWTPDGRRTVDFLGIPLRVDRYVRRGGTTS